VVCVVGGGGGRWEECKDCDSSARVSQTFNVAGIYRLSSENAVNWYSQGLPASEHFFVQIHCHWYICINVSERNALPSFSRLTLDRSGMVF